MHWIPDQPRGGFGADGAQWRIKFFDGLEVAEFRVAVLAMIHEVPSAGDTAQVLSIAHRQRMHPREGSLANVGDVRQHRWRLLRDPVHRIGTFQACVVIVVVGELKIRTRSFELLVAAGYGESKYTRRPFTL